MPNASTGGTEDRASQDDARSPGTASEGPRLHTTEQAPTARLRPGEVRIDSLDQYGNVTITTSYGVVRDHLVETRMEASYGHTTEVTYTFLSGMAWRGGRQFEPGMVMQASEFGYNRGGYGPRPGFIRRNDGLIPEAPCGCDICVSRREGNRWIEAREDPIERYNRIYADRWGREAETDRLLREQRQRESQERVRRMQAAEARAEETLKLVLLPDELKRYEKDRRIIVTGADKRQYEIGPGTVSNVHLLSKTGDNVLASLCCHPAMYGSGNYKEPLPDRDAHVAQIPYLRYDLDKFYETANIDWHDSKALDEYLKSLTIRRRMARERARDLTDRALDLADRIRP